MLALGLDDRGRQGGEDDVGERDGGGVDADVGFG